MGDAANGTDVRLERVQPLPHQGTLEESAYLELRRLIIEGALHPGGRISVNAMAQRLGVSRLPVIHALRTLASEGFVQLRPHRHVVVANPTAREIRGQFLMFAALEEVAIREAWPLMPADVARMESLHQRLTDELGAGAFGEQTDHAFHDVLWRAAGIECLYTSIDTLWNLTAYYRLLVYKKYAGNIGDRVAEHAAILRAAAHGTLEEAIEQIRRHRLSSLRRAAEVALPMPDGAGEIEHVE